MNSQTPGKTLIAGIGNPIRTDDGIGEFVCNKIALLEMAGVSTLTLQQLQPEQIDTFLQYDYVIIVDASSEGQDAEIFPLNKAYAGSSSTHHMNPGLLISLAELTGMPAVNLVMCRVRGYEFGFGERLSADAEANANKAVTLIQQWIKEH